MTCSPSPPSSPDVLAVDRDPVHLRLAEHNAAALGLSVTTWLGDVEDADLSGVRGRVRRPGPALRWSPDALVRRLAVVGLVYRPGRTGAGGGQGCTRASTTLWCPPSWELEFVAQDGDLKEAALWSPGFATTPRRATVIDGRGLVLDGLG